MKEDKRKSIFKLDFLFISLFFLPTIHIVFIIFFFQLSRVHSLIILNRETNIKMKEKSFLIHVHVQKPINFLFFHVEWNIWIFSWKHWIHFYFILILPCSTKQSWIFVKYSHFFFHFPFFFLLSFAFPFKEKFYYAQYCLFAENSFSFFFL